jgi:hypothetical protein
MLNTLTKDETIFIHSLILNAMFNSESAKSLLVVGSDLLPFQYSSLESFISKRERLLVLSDDEYYKKKNYSLFKQYGNILIVNSSFRLDKFFDVRKSDVKQSNYSNNAYLYDRSYKHLVRFASIIPVKIM